MLRKFAAGIFFISSLANAASFDCSKAFSDVEKLICNTPSLSKADDELYVDYLQAKVVTGNSDDFKKLVKQNWKLREQNCKTEECLLSWYKRSTDLYRSISSSKEKISDSDSDGNELYYGKRVNISGVINRESAGFPSLRPDNILSVSSIDGNSEGLEPSEYGVGVIQLVISSDKIWDKFEKNKGSKAIVLCNLYHAHTIHHKTPVLCTVEDIKVEGISKANSPTEIKSNAGSSTSKKKTSDDFFIENPKLATFNIKRAVKTQSLGNAFADIALENTGDKNKFKAASDQMNEHGYEYTKIAIPQLRDVCSLGMTSTYGLDKDDCERLQQYRP